MAGTEGVGNHYLQVTAQEGEVVVAPVPDDQRRFLLRLGDDGGVVHAGPDHQALADEGLVLFAFLDGRVMKVEIGQGGEALHPLSGQVSVGHGVADERRPHAVRKEHVGDEP